MDDENIDEHTTLIADSYQLRQHPIVQNVRDFAKEVIYQNRRSPTLQVPSQRNKNLHEFSKFETPQTQSPAYKRGGNDRRINQSLSDFRDEIQNRVDADANYGIITPVSRDDADNFGLVLNACAILRLRDIRKTIIDQR